MRSLIVEKLQAYFTGAQLCSLGYNEYPYYRFLDIWRNQHTKYIKQTKGSFTYLIVEYQIMFFLNGPFQVPADLQAQYPHPASGGRQYLKKKLF